MNTSFLESLDQAKPDALVISSARGIRPITALLVVLLAAAVCSIARSRVRPFWHDEIYTVFMSRLPVSSLEQALDQAVDTAPPLFDLIGRAARIVVPQDHIAYRLPSVVGVLLAVYGLYLFLRRLVHGWAAAAGASSVLCTMLLRYAVEARPYALLAGFVAIAAAAWQRIDRSRLHALGFAAALAGAVSVHYYAVLVWPLFAMAEAAVWLVERRFRMLSWAALAAGLAPLCFTLRFLLSLRRTFGQNFWAIPSLSKSFGFYDGIFHFATHNGSAVGAGIAALFGAMIVAGRQRIGMTPPDDLSPEHAEGLPVPELVLIAAFLCLPPIAGVASKVAHAGMVARYVFPTVLGGALAIGCLLQRMPRFVSVVVVGIAILCCVLSATDDVRRAWGGAMPERGDESRAVKDAMKASGEPGLSLVVSSGLQYLPLAFYTPKPWQGRLYFLADRVAAVHYAHADSVDTGLLLLRRYAPLQVEEYSRFAAAHGEFLLMSNGDRWDWWPRRLLEEGDTLRLVAASGDARTYKVTLRR